MQEVMSLIWTAIDLIGLTFLVLGFLAQTNVWNLKLYKRYLKYGYALLCASNLYSGMNGNMLALVMFVLDLYFFFYFAKDDGGKPPKPRKQLV